MSEPGFTGLSDLQDFDMLSCSSFHPGHPDSDGNMKELIKIIHTYHKNDKNSKFQFVLYNSSYSLYLQRAPTSYTVCHNSKVSTFLMEY